jgi:prepilin-type N-terminal cleavage/methylation domain-containing protein
MKINIYKKGFTLIEVMTALSIFAVVMTISMGAILGVFDANRKSESLKTIMDNLNFSMETMAREIRFAKNYNCNTVSIPDCASSGNGWINFLSADGKQVYYQLNNTWIEKSTDAGVTFIPITSPEVTITGLRFFVYGASPTDGIQPRVLMQIKGFAGTKTKTSSSFTLQTLVAQRARDN